MIRRPLNDEERADAWSCDRQRVIPGPVCMGLGAVVLEDEDGLYTLLCKDCLEDLDERAGYGFHAFQPAPTLREMRSQWSVLF